MTRGKLDLIINISRHGLPSLNLSGSRNFPRTVGKKTPIIMSCINSEVEEALGEEACNENASRSSDSSKATMEVTRSPLGKKRDSWSRGSRYNPLH